LERTKRDEGRHVGSIQAGESMAMHPWDIVSDNDLPSDADIQQFWDCGTSRRDDNASMASSTANIPNRNVLVQATNLEVTREDTTLLSHLNWTVQRGERWHLAGANGAGKSTLSRLLLRKSISNKKDAFQKSNIDNKQDAVISEGTLDVTTPSHGTSSGGRHVQGGISWVSTELHLHATHNWGSLTVREILVSGASFLFYADKNRKDSSNGTLENNALNGHFNDSSSIDVDRAITAASWLGLFDNDTTNRKHNHSFLSRQFSTLSQGQQKLLLIASAIAQRPTLLVLDEPCQGLDLWNRGHLLALVERICRVLDMGLLYVTHHDEELIPSIGHRLSLDDGDVTYCGLR